MLIPRLVACMLLLVIVLGADVVFGQTTSTGSGQAYPNKPVRIVTAETGGGTDFAARLIAQGISGPLGQTVIVDNRGTGISSVVVSQAPPDGYTLLVTGTVFWTGPLLQKAPYDPVRDFSPISWATMVPNILVVHPSLPVKSVKELIALAKARPGALNYSSGATGSSSHLAPEIFKAMTGVNIVRIPYKGTGPALNGVIGGEVQLTFATAGTIESHVKSGKLRALAVTSAEPSVLAPDLPTLAAAGGLPNFESVAMTSIFAPAKTPEAIINRLNQEIVRFLKSAPAKEQFLNSGVETVGSSPEQLAAKIKSEIALAAKVIKDAGIKVD